MITATVNARHEIIVRVPILDAIGQPRDVEFTLDTGFSGALTLPPAIIGALGLPWKGFGYLVLGNGQIEQYDQYTATIVWDGAPRSVLVDAVEVSPLLGMKLLAGNDLKALLAPGGRVEIEAIP
jgi:predicted aspartyl protease